MRIILYIMLLLFFVRGYSQDYIKEDGTTETNQTVRKHASFWDNMRFGGNFMIMPSSYYGYNELYVDISPMVAYQFNKRLMAGNYFVYKYYRNDFYQVKTSIYGIKPLVQLVLINNIDELFSGTTNLNLGFSLVAQQPFLSVEKKLFYEGTGRKWITATLAGLMIVQRVGDRGGFYLSLLWGLAGNPEYYLLQEQSNPIIDIGFYF